MTRCVERVFELLPPEQDALPEQDFLIDRTICIQAFVMNVFGALDNLAWIWVSEKPLAVDRIEIGLGPKCKAVRASFSPEMRDYLSKNQNWNGGSPTLSILGMLWRTGYPSTFRLLCARCKRRRIYGSRCSQASDAG